MNLLRNLSLIIFLATLAFPLHSSEAESFDQFINDCFKNTTSLELSQLRQDVRGLTINEQRQILCVAMELSNQPETLHTTFSPFLMNRRAFIGSHLELACAVARAFADCDDIAQATTMLEQIPSSKGELQTADRLTIQIQIDITQRNLSSAKNLYKQAQQHLRQAIPEKRYETWHSRLLHWRLNRQQSQIDRLAAEFKGGEAYAQWLKADQNGKTAAYNTVKNETESPLIKDAATLRLAEIKLQENASNECLELLNNGVIHGLLSVEANVLIGDAFIIQGQLDTAHKFYLQALKDLKRKVDLSQEDDILIKAIRPTKALHGFNNRSFPQWQSLKPGTILLPGAADWISDHWRYQLILRLAIIAKLKGDKHAGATLVRSLMTFDPIDRDMKANKRQAGGQILAALIESENFYCDLSPLAQLPLDLQSQVFIALAFYQVYDWHTANIWMTRACSQANKKPEKISQYALKTMRLIHMYILRSIGKEDVALKLANNNTLIDKSPLAAQIYYRTFRVEYQIRIEKSFGNHSEYEHVLTLLNEAHKQIGFSQFKIELMDDYLCAAMCHDNKLALKLATEYVKHYPNRTDWAYLLSDINSRIKDGLPNDDLCN